MCETRSDRWDAIWFTKQEVLYLPDLISRCLKSNTPQHIFIVGVVSRRRLFFSFILHNVVEEARDIWSAYNINDHMIEKHDFATGQLVAVTHLSFIFIPNYTRKKKKPQLIEYNWRLRHIIVRKSSLNQVKNDVTLIML